MARLSVAADPELAQRAQLVLGVVHTAACDVVDQHGELAAALEELARDLRGRFQGNAAERPEVAATRRAYRDLGDDPTHYRPANEALLRRVLSGKPLPNVNSAVDTNNYLSLASGWPCGCYNAAALVGPVVARRGTAGEQYAPIGKPPVEATNRIVLADDRGIFGSPRADSQRTMVTPGVTSIVFVIFGFGIEPATMTPLTETAAELLQRYCGAVDIEQLVV